MKYNKLVRDKIPEYIRSKNGNPIYHVADTVEYRQKLLEKLHEEVKEFEESGEIDEIADILEVLAAIASEKGFHVKQIEEIRHEKAKERGRFVKRIILDES